MEYKEAKKIADEIVSVLSKYCEEGYCEIAGSVRREKKEINHDIEIVCIPKLEMAQDGLFDESPVRVTGFVSYLNSFPKISGDPEINKQIKRKLDCGLNLEIYTADRDNWGYIYAIRTGSEMFSKSLAYQWVQRHYYGEGGYLRNPGGSIHPVPTEEYLFKLLGMEYIPPEFRSI